MTKLYYMSFYDECGPEKSIQLPGRVVYGLAETPELALGNAIKDNLENLRGAKFKMGRLEPQEIILVDNSIEKNIRYAVDSLFEDSDYAFYGMAFVNLNNNSQLESQQNNDYGILFAHTVAQSEEEALGRLILSSPDCTLYEPSDIHMTVSTLHKVSLSGNHTLPKRKRNRLAKEIERYWSPLTPEELEDAKKN